MTGDDHVPAHQAWAHLRFSVVGPLLSAPPARGQLKAAIALLADKSWRHPVTDRPVRFAPSTIEHWYYQARRAKQDPVGVLRSRVRKDAGTSSAISSSLSRKLIEQYRQYRHWSVKLHHDNLKVLVNEEPDLEPMPSYSSLRRFMRAHGMDKQPRRRGRNRPGVARAEARREEREVRSFESEYVNGLWHLDFHTSSLPVLTSQGEWVYPHLLGVLDDHSRLAPHVQWYWSQAAQDLVHGLSQAIAKRGLSRALMMDNGSAMVAEEVRQGLERLGIVQEFTLPYSPQQNGKQEAFWAVVEGRLMAMLHGVSQLTLSLLNQATQAWVDLEYNRTEHSETGQEPLDRFTNGPQVGRPSPSSEQLIHAFRQDVSRIQRRSDGTLTLDGVRFELPSRFHHLRRVTVRYARWNLGCVHLVDPRTDTLLAPIHPLDKARHADGQRRRRPPLMGPEPVDTTNQPEELAPLLRKLLADYAASGIPPAYVPTPDPKDQSKEVDQ